MLNELYALGATLESMKISTFEWHKNFKELPKINKVSAFKISIGAKDNFISSITEIKEQKKLDCLRKWVKSNGLSFPCFNIGPVAPEAKEKFLSALGSDALSFDFVKARRDGASQIHKKRFNDRLEWCICKLPKELKAKLKTPPTEFICVSKLIERLDGISPDFFMEEIAKYLCNNLDGAAENFSPLMFFESDVSETAKNLSSISIVLDIDDYDDYPVAHEKTHLWINERLIKSEKETKNREQMKISYGEAENAQEDAFGGSASGNQSKLPDVKLRFKYAVHLRSMVKESPCQYRYGKADFESFSIGSDNRTKLKSALEWLSDDEFVGLTWQKVGSEELLFAYPSKLPSKEKLPPLGRLLAASDYSKEIDIDIFSKLSKEVIDCLYGISKDINTIEIRAFVLRQRKNDARTKVVYNISFSAQTLKDKAQEWEAAAKNIPPITIKEWGENKNEFKTLSFYSPKPDEIARAVNRVWKLDGNWDKAVKALEMTAGIDILLDRLDKASLSHILNILIQNGKGLIIATGASAHKGEVLGNGKAARYKTLLPTVMGMLLYKLGQKKEDYMKSQAFLIGQLLALSDRLHFLYCQEVRGSIPPQLLGNALMLSALSSPKRAFATLAQRIPPYIAWADTNQTEKAGLTRWFKKKFAEISNSIMLATQDKAIDTRLDDNEKSMLLLGYLSGVHKQEENKTEGDTKNV